ncbi:MAG: stage IV sporulation protein A [Lachnospiraceae bacterium]|nr:stage IV sporulation protein A [Lachnospiraceae bacterium]
MDKFNVYNDINVRTNGEIYIGVVGPVRTGKSTFIKRFLEQLVIPNIADVHTRQRTIDEIPQSANGKIIMTTEPKFIPKDAALVKLDDNTKCKFKLIDCVGFMVEGAMGHIEENQERMVKTPWQDKEIPFTKAAEIGTKRVINEHATIGIVITTDGSFTDIKREAYESAEELSINELKKSNKPFVIVLNSNNPYSVKNQELSKELEEKYNTKVIPLNCEQLRKNDIEKILENILTVFPIEKIEFITPKWLEMLDDDNEIKKSAVNVAKYIIKKSDKIYKLCSISEKFEDDSFINDFMKNENNEVINYIKRVKLDSVDYKNGNAIVEITLDKRLYYEIISELSKTDIKSEYMLINKLKELSEFNKDNEMISKAFKESKETGYGIIMPEINEIKIENPKIIKHGGKYGVKINAVAPSVHMMVTNISVEIAPIIGTLEQAKDLEEYIKNNADNKDEGIWETNIFGKSIRQLIDEGIREKVNKMNNETKTKMQETLQKIINESSGGVICIII